MRPLDSYLGSACKIALLNEHFDKFRLIKLGRNDNILSLLDIRADSDDKLGVAFEFLISIYKNFFLTVNLNYSTTQVTKLLHIYTLTAKIFRTNSY